MKAEPQIEIERKFLVLSLPNDVKNSPRRRISQGYILITDDKEVRIRESDGRYTLTEKIGCGLARKEHEQEIDKDTFTSLWPKTENRRITKTRFLIENDCYIIDLDVFDPPFAPLVIAEIEFSSVTDAESAYIPEWFGREVTNDKRFKNKNLVLLADTGEILNEYRNICNRK